MSKILIVWMLEMLHSRHLNRNPSITLMLAMQQLQHHTCIVIQA